LGINHTGQKKAVKFLQFRGLRLALAAGFDTLEPAFRREIPGAGDPILLQYKTTTFS
jgi:hypothetical protein